MYKPKRGAARPVNPAQVRGDIQRGRTGDKVPGFDPAVVPLETDSEAGGAPMPVEHVEAARQEQPGNGHKGSTGHGDAMRPFSGPPGNTGTSALLIAGAIVLLGVSVLFLI